MSSAEATIQEMAGVEDARLADQNAKTRTPTAGIIKDTDANISLVGFILMLLLAVMFDIAGFIINLIPFVGGVIEDLTITPMAIFAFWIWFKMKGISLTKGTRKLVTAACIVVGFIPIINALPKWTCEIVYMYISVKGSRLAKNAFGKK